MKNKIKLAWLAGIIDGEGAIHIVVSNKRLVAKVEITNTSKLMMNEVKLILKELGINCYEYTRIVKNRRVEYRVYIHRLKDVEVLLKKILPLLIAKKEQAELLIEFCQLRNKKNKSNLISNWKEEKELSIKVKSLNKGINNQ